LAQLLNFYDELATAISLGWNFFFLQSGVPPSLTEDGGEGAKVVDKDRGKKVGRPS
jgi:hypothetical protein